MIINESTMRRLPTVFALQDALKVLSSTTDVLPAVGGATEDELRPDADEREDDHATGEETLLDTPFEVGNAELYVPLTPLTRRQEHVFQRFLDGSMRSFFVGTALEHDRQTPVIIGQIGCAALGREMQGRLRVVRHVQSNLLLLACSQISDEVKGRVEEAVSAFRPRCDIADIEQYGSDRADFRSRAQDTMRIRMLQAESETLVETLQDLEDGWAIADGSIRFAKFFEDLTARYGDGQPPVVSVAKNFSRKPRFQHGRGPRSRTLNLWQLLADLPSGNRTLAFLARTQDRRVAVWYIRLRMKAFMDYPLMGVIKVELPILGEEPPTSDLITKLSNALLAERTVTPHGADRRWHAHLYPIFQAERCVKNSFVSTSTLRSGLRWPGRLTTG